MTRPFPFFRHLVVSLVGVALCACSLRAAGENEGDRIAKLLRLQQGQVVADVGAGDGDFIETLAESVGVEGHVFATEVKQNLVDALDRRISERGLRQVTTILGNQDDLGLSAGCCDAILLRLVYHHFEDPETMRFALWQALKPNGLIAIVDITPQETWRELPEVPDRGGHGIATDDLLAEMLATGFDLVERLDGWNDNDDRYAALFRRPADRTPRSR